MRENGTLSKKHWKNHLSVYSVELMSYFCKTTLNKNYRAAGNNHFEMFRKFGKQFFDDFVVMVRETVQLREAGNEKTMHGVFLVGHEGGH